jgi:hypothetical protein
VQRPTSDIAHLPMVRMPEARLDRVVGKLVDQCQRHRWPCLDAFAALLTLQHLRRYGDGMHHGMHNRGCCAAAPDPPDRPVVPGGP